MAKFDSLQEVNDYAAACGRCEYPSCSPPRREAQAIKVDACGYPMPDFDVVPDSEACKIWKSKTTSFESVQSSSEDGDTYDATTNIHEAFVFSYNETNACVRSWTSGTYSSVENSTSTVEGELVVDRTTTVEMTRNGEGGITGYTGTVTVVDHLDSENNTSGPTFVSGPAIDITPSTGWSYSDGVFTKIESGSGITETFTVTYSNQLTETDLLAEITRRITALAGADWPTSDFFASGGSDAFFTYDYTWAEDDPDHESDPVCSQPIFACKSRYRFGIPDGFSTEELPRTTYEVKWEVYFFPTKWLEWEQAVADRKAAQEAHAAWEALPVEDRGVEPVVPDDPGAEPTPKPDLVSSNEWVWDGNTENPWSSWYESTPRAADGVMRVVNVGIICYRSRYGILPSRFWLRYIPSE